MTEDGPRQMHIMMIHDFVEANGKTIRENNMEKAHHLREGQEVRLLGEEPGDPDQGIAFILLCGRDCDGTPLYWLGGQAQWNEMQRLGRERTIDNMGWRIFNRVDGGYPEDSLEPSDFRADVRKMFQP